MTFDQIPAAAAVFLDANTLVYDPGNEAGHIQARSASE
jgi:hypothetical protein